MACKRKSLCHFDTNVKKDVRPPSNTKSLYILVSFADPFWSLATLSTARLSSPSVCRTVRKNLVVDVQRVTPPQVHTDLHARLAALVGLGHPVPHPLNCVSRSRRGACHTNSRWSPSPAPISGAAIATEPREPDPRRPPSRPRPRRRHGQGQEDQGGDLRHQPGQRGPRQVRPMERG